MSIDKRPRRAPPPLLPPEFISNKIRCTSCKRPFDLLQKQAFANEPAAPKEGGGHWVRLSQEIKCAACGNQEQIFFPTVKKKGSVSFFGDEAVRQVGKHFVFTYSLVGGSPEPLSSIGESLVSLKHELEPNIDPKLWTFHLTKMWSGQKRLRHRVYRKWDRAKVEHAASSMAAILSAKKNALWLWNVTHVTTFGGTPANSQLRNWVRDQTFTTMLMDAINETTKLGARPDFTFDATAIKAGKPKKAGWAQECLLGLRDTLLYGFLVRGMAIEAPKIVLPGSTSGLEFADLISFTIGRYFHTRLLDRSVDIDPAVLGKIRYGAILNFSDYIYSESEGYPWDELFEGKL